MQTGSGLAYSVGVGTACSDQFAVTAASPYSLASLLVGTILLTDASDVDGVLEVIPTECLTNTTGTDLANTGGNK